MRAPMSILMNRWHRLQKTRGPVPEAPKKLAGGEARSERNHRNPEKGRTRPEGGARSRRGISGAASGAHSLVVGFRWFRSFLASPPANFRCASGAFSNDDCAGDPRDFSARLVLCTFVFAASAAAVMPPFVVRMVDFVKNI